MVKIVGITGGIGSGKTTVCKAFRMLGIPVFEADIAARLVMNRDEKLKALLNELAGETVYHDDGTLNRGKLAEILFNDDKIRESVNALVHPAVHKLFYRWVDAHYDAPYGVYEAAILFEGGFYKQTDYTILVAAPEEKRIARVVKYRGLTPQQVQERIASQWPEARKRELADVVLENDNRHLNLPEIIRMDKKLRKDGTIC